MQTYDVVVTHFNNDGTTINSVEFSDGSLAMAVDVAAKTRKTYEARGYRVRVQALPHRAAA